MTFLYKSEPIRGAEWKAIFARREPDLPFRIWPDIGDPKDVRYLAAWIPPDDVAETFPNLEILFSTGAGVDQFDLAKLPPHLPLVRMVEPGIIDGMVEYVTMATLALHRDLLVYIGQQHAQTWEQIRVVPASDRHVGVLGLGVLGQAVCDKLASFGFQVAGWSRSPRSLEDVVTFCGSEQLEAFLGRSDILICLLPLTPETRGFLNGSLISKLPRGAKLINVGRGAHLDQEALCAALNSGQISHAVLDVTDPEPLPADHPLWRNPRVLITPHIASMTQPKTAAHFVLDNLRRHRTGQPLVGLVDRTRGY
jgi:glyoxylate/hydroxypyruvate reductase A